MAIEVRTIDDADVEGWVDCMSVGFLTQTAEGEATYRRTGIDLTRAWGAFERDRVVGTLRSFPTSLTTPGPTTVTAAALTNVAVVPTHRRQGLLTEMITADLRASAERGEVVGILIAAEYPIYGRFGYGPAVEGASYAVDSVQARFRGTAPGSVELVDEAALRKEAPPLYDRFRLAQPGSIERPDRWWDRVLHQVDVPGQDPWKGYQALYRGPDGDPEGYIRYQAKEEWDAMRPKATATVNELVALTSRAYHRLWQFCCEIDLVTGVEAGDRSVEEALPWLLEDGRVVRQTGRYDFVWVRMLDVAGALSGRTYMRQGRVVIEAVDPMGLAAGRFALDGGPDGGNCKPSRETAGVTLPVAALGAAYLGGVSLRTLAAAGVVDEHAPGALDLADTMLRSATVPWCSTWF